MAKIFQLKPDWFETKIMPAIQKRSIIAAFIILFCVIAWLYYESLAPLIIVVFVVAERIFEYVQIPSTKNLLSSMSVAISESGLLFQCRGINGGILYPWSSLSFKINKNKLGMPEEIIIEDKTRKGSKVPLTGYEDMSELTTQIENHANQS